MTLLEKTSAMSIEDAPHWYNQHRLSGGFFAIFIIDYKPPFVHVQPYISR
jgi:hypothetical protein